MNTAAVELGELANDSNQVASVSALRVLSPCFILIHSRLARRSYQTGDWVR
jgi:hypothetical protein